MDCKEEDELEELKREVEALRKSLKEEEDRHSRTLSDLREARENLGALLEGVPASAFLMDRDGTIIAANTITAVRLGRRVDEIVNRCAYDLLSEDIVAERKAHVENVVMTGEPEVFEDRRTGISILNHLFPVKDGSGLTTRVAVISVDVSDRKESEQKLKDAIEDLEHSNLELERFAYVASHDLQEPLRVISSYAQLLARRYMGKLDGDADDFINIIVDATKRMKSLINDLLEFSRVGTRGKAFERVDSLAVLNKVLSMLDAAIVESGAVISCGSLPAVWADDIQLSQVFQNLISNAIKFRSERSPEISISAEKREGSWVFSVKDNGIGIEKAYFDKIFIIFQRLHTSREYPGTGIGLALAQKIVERHGGRIWVESEPGKGSVFNFSIPARGDRDCDI